MNRIMAIIERDLRRFRRSPTLIIVSMVMPLVQLVVLGYAFGGKVKHLKVGILDQDRGMPAIKVREMASAVAANAQTFESIYYNDQGTALRDLHDGKISGLLNIPPEFSRKVLAGTNPKIALVEDNTDQFAASFARPPGRQRHALGGRGLSLRALHPVFAAGDDCAGDLCLGHDRRGDHFY